jgi:hypothetical protein
MTKHETYSIITNPLTDLALPADVEARLIEALDSPDKMEITSTLEDAINARLAESGWDGDWTATEVVTEILDQHDHAEDTTASTHPYFVAKARDLFARAGGDPDLSGYLARWAQTVVDDDPRRGVIVAKDGSLLAETRYIPGGPGAVGATYVTAVSDGLPPAGILDTEVGLAEGALRKATGQAVIHVRHSQVCRGASCFIRPV